MKNWLLRKDPDAGKDWRQEEETTEDEMVEMASSTWWTWVWASSGSWWWTGKPTMLQSMGRRELDVTAQLNWTDVLLEIVILNYNNSVLVAQSHLILCDSMDCSPPGSSVHGILQARILEWGAIHFSMGSFSTRDWTQVSCFADNFLPLIHKVNNNSPIPFTDSNCVNNVRI